MVDNGHVSDSVTVIVLAGGTSRRFGSDKLAAVLPDGRAVLDACLSGMPSAWPIVVVGPSRPVPSEVADRVRFVREDPPSSGPLAGIAAGLELVETDLACVVAGDTPRAGLVVASLVDALAEETIDGVPAPAAVMSDGEGQSNPLLAAYRVEALRDAMPAEPANRAARTLLALPHVLVRPETEIWDVDHPEDLQR